MNSRPPVKPDHHRAVQARHRRVQAPGADDHLHLRLARQFGHARPRRFRVDRPPLRGSRQEALGALADRDAVDPDRPIRVVVMSGRPRRCSAPASLSPWTCRRRPPFALRARLLTPLATGGTLHEPDGLLVGRRRRAGSRPPAPAADAARRRRRRAIDLRPWVVLPGMVDLHAHLPQLPNAGLGLRARPADLARAATPSRPSGRGRTRPRRAARAGRFAGVRGGRHDHGAGLRRGLRGRDGRRVPRRPRRTASGRSSAR